MLPLGRKRDGLVRVLLHDDDFKLAMVLFHDDCAIVTELTGLHVESRCQCRLTPVDDAATQFIGVLFYK